MMVKRLKKISQPPPDMLALVDQYFDAHLPSQDLKRRSQFHVAPHFEIKMAPSLGLGSATVPSLSS